jgi:hypothetical protein
VSENGEWVGFRTPFSSLRRTASYFGFVVLLCIVSMTGWLMSRWQVQRLANHYASERLKSSALEAQLNDIKARGAQALAAGVAGGDGAGSVALSSFSLIPSLDSDELKSSVLELDDMSTEYNPSSKEWALKFEVVRQPPREGSARYYWVALLHGPQGLLSFPSTLSSRKGEAVLFHRGQVLDDVRTRRAVSARFKVDGFFERGESEPVYVTLLIYDNKGSLLLRRRAELLTKRSPGDD